jgi:RNA polymerase subunit RPABC4/transcription elongation factor Spt4
MKCQQCSRDVTEDATFCPYCGERMDRSPKSAMEVVVEQTPTAAADRLQPGVKRGGKQPPEAELWADSYSPKELLTPFIAFDLLLLLAIVGILSFANTGEAWLYLVLGSALLYGGLGLFLVYKRLSVRYRLTTYRFFHERGLLARQSDRLEVIDIDDVTVQQSFIERIVGIGTIVIQSSDRTNPQLLLPAIDNVRAVADLIDATCRAERQRRAIHIESV